MTDCERYEHLMAWVIGPASDPAASDEDRELSDEDIEWMLCHQDLCKNPEHSTANWRETLERCDQRLAERFRNALEDLKRQERGVLTPDSPHHWAIEALKEAGVNVRGLPELIGCGYVFTYNEDETDGDQTTQCGVVCGTITGTSASSYLYDKERIEAVTLTVEESRALMLNVDGRKCIARVIGLLRVSNDSPRDAGPMRWRLIVYFFENPHVAFTGTLVIFPNNREK